MIDLFEEKMGERMNKIQKLERIYARLPKIKCKKKCFDGCGPIIMTKLEKDRIIERVGYNPFKPIIKTLQELIANGFNGNKIDVTCPLLDKKKECSVYDIRPFICRIYALVKKMQCPHGCVPERWLSDKEALKMQIEIESLRDNYIDKEDRFNEN